MTGSLLGGHRQSSLAAEAVLEAVEPGKVRDIEATVFESAPNKTYSPRHCLILRLGVIYLTRQ